MFGSHSCLKIIIILLLLLLGGGGGEGGRCVCVWGGGGVNKEGKPQGFSQITLKQERTIPDADDVGSISSLRSALLSLPPS